MKFLYLLPLLSLVAGIQLSLQARGIESNNDVPLVTFDFNPNTLTISSIDQNKNEVFGQQPYCINIYSDDTQFESRCFQFMKLSSPFHYTLVLDIHHNQIHKISLDYDENANGIIPEVRLPVRGPSPAAIKLKKVTKTYKDKKAGDKALTAQFEEDVEVQNESWMQKNWKKLVMVAVIYSAVTSFTSGTQKQSPNKND